MFETRPTIGEDAMSCPSENLGISATRSNDNQPVESLLLSGIVAVRSGCLARDMLLLLLLLLHGGAASTGRQRHQLHAAAVAVAHPFWKSAE